LIEYLIFSNGYSFVQDFKAEKAMQALLSMAAPEAHALRKSVVQKIKAETLVVGDIVQLNTGDVVPADIRLLSCQDIEVSQASLTGESEPIAKHAEQLVLGRTELSVGERLNMVYSTTQVDSGRGMGVVVAVGNKTQVGMIAADLGRKEPVTTSTNPFRRVYDKIWLGTKNILGLVGTPLQVKLSKFAMLLFLLAALLAIIVFSVSKWQLNNDVVLYGICVAVAVIPESLIAVITITIAVGASAMSKVNVVIRHKPVLEAVGGVTDICSDKTGTLTQGQMSVHKVWIPAVGTLKIQFSNDVLNPNEGTFELENTEMEKDNLMHGPVMQSLKPLLDAVALCNSAKIYQPDPSSEKQGSGYEKWTGAGQPTDMALQVFAMRFNNGRNDILKDDRLSPVAEHQFNSTTKKMSVAYKDKENGEVTVFVKGAYDTMLPALLTSAEDKIVLNQHLQALEHEALRVICVATKTVSEDQITSLKNRETMESNLVFHGLVGIYDPPREQSLSAVMKCHQAGIVVHMLTGDAVNTATAIAKKVGILSLHHSMDAVMKAQDFDRMSEAQIDAMPALPLVIARCSPQTKVKMVEALGRRNAFCAMTGDGVNDAPALERAPVGIAMGIAGTDVAKNAADMILTDDNFASIVKAIEEGRRLFDNIQKVSK
jgi:Na+-exporting ATPase